MTLSKEDSEPRVFAGKFNQLMYGALVALGFYLLLAKKDVPAAMSNFGIALIFDPFDQKVMWNHRPSYQKIWLIVHLSIVFGLLGIAAFDWFVS